MSKFSNTIEYNIKTNLDASGLNKLQQQLNIVAESFSKLNKNSSIYSSEAYNADIQKISKIQKALAQSFNSNLNVLDLNKFSKGISDMPLSDIQAMMSKTTEGAAAFTNILGTIGKIDTGFKSISSVTDKIINTFGNTVRWGITASVFQTIQNSLYRSVDYVKDLDTSLNNIQIVTDASAENMRNFSLKANEAAANLGSSTVAFTDAAQLYAQNGYSEEDYTKLAELTTKVANVTQQSTSEVSEQITSLMAGYKMSIDEAEDSLSGMAVVAAESASDLGELANAEQKVASAASTLGVSQDQLTAQLSTIISVTRQAPEQVGNSLKTIYARLGDLQMGKTLDDGVSLGGVSSALEKVGVAVLDVNGDMRSMGDIIEDLMAKWQDLSTAQQQALAVKLAGKYQYNNLMTLMSNSDMYKEQKNTFNSSQGALDKQQGIYMESLQAKIQKLQTTWEGFITELVDSNNFKGAIDGFSSLIDGATGLTEALGGMEPVLTLISSLMLKSFSSQISSGIANMIDNASRRSILQQNNEELLQMFGGQDMNGTAGYFLTNTVESRGILSKEQAEQYNQELSHFVEIDKQVQIAQENYNQAQIASKENLDKQNQVLATYNLQLSKEGELYGENADKIRKLQASREDAEIDADDISTVAGQIKGLSSDKDISANEKRVKAKSILGNLYGVSRLTNGDLQDYSEIYNTLSDEKASVEEIEQALSKLHYQLTETYTGWSELSNQVLADNKDLAAAEEALRQLNLSADEETRAKKALDAAYAAKEKADEDALAKAKALDQQQQISNIVNMASAVGQLAFAWQSVSNIGKILEDKDISSAEKMQSIIQNMVIALPMLASSLQQIKKLIEQFDIVKLLGNSENALTGIINTFLLFKQQSGSTLTALAAGFTQTLNVIRSFSKSLFGLVGAHPILAAIAAVFAVIGSAISSANEKIKQQKEEIKTSGEEAEQHAKALSDSKNNFDKLYQQYKNGEISSDQLKEAADSLNETLDDQQAKALSAAGAWDEYAKKVDAASQEAQDKDFSKIKALRDSVGQESENFDLIKFITGQQSDYELVSGAYSSKTAVPSLVQQDYSSTNSLVYDSIKKEYAFKYGASVEQKAEDLDKMLSAYDNAIEDQKKKLEEIKQAYGDSSTEYSLQKAVLDNLTAGQSSLNSLYASQKDNIDQLDAAQQSLLDSTIASHGNDNEFQYQNEQTIDDYKKQIEQHLRDLGVITEDMGSDKINEILDAFVNGMASANTNTSAALAERNGKEQIELAFGQGLYQSIQTSRESGSSIFGSTEDVNNILSSSNLDTSTYSKEVESQINDALVKQIIEQINSSSLSDEDKQTLMSGIDWSQPINQILGTVSQSIKNGKAIDTSYDDSTDSQTRKTHLKDTYKVEDSTISAYKDLATATELVSNRQQVLKQDVEDSTREFGEDSDAAKQAQKNLDGYNDSLDDLATMAIQSQKGMGKLQTALEDNKDILASGDKESLDYAEAIGTVKDAVADLVNVSSDDLSSQFIVDNLSLIQQAADGDVDALNQLRAAAATEIVASFSCDTSEADYLIEKANELTSMDIEPYASIDDTDFINTLNNMLENGDISAKQLNDYLNSINVDPNLSYEESTAEAFKIPATSIPINVLGLDIGGIDIPEMSISSVTKVPHINSLSSGGGGSYTPVRSSGGSSKKSSSGGGKKGSGGKGSGGKGSGSGKSYTPKTKDKQEDEFDRYEKVNAHLDRLSKTLDKLADAQDRLTGKKLADNMAEQAAILEQQVKWQKEKLELQQQEASELQGKLAAYGVQFDSEGYISNYKEAYYAQLNKYNSAIDAYNADGTEAGQEAQDKIVEQAKKSYDDFKDLISEYDDLRNSTIEESLKDIEDYYDKIEDLRINAFKKSVEAVDDMKDMRETLIDFNAIFRSLAHDTDFDEPFNNMATNAEKLKQYWDMDKVAMNGYYDELIKNNKEAMSQSGVSNERKNWLISRNQMYENAKNNLGNGTLEAGGTGYLDMEMKNLNDIMEQINQFETTGTSSIFGENSADLYDVAKSIFESATSMAEDLKSEMDDLKSNIIDGIGNIGDAIDKQLDKFDNINDTLEHYADMIEMVSGDQAYDKLNAVYEAQIKNGRAELDTLKASIGVLEDLQKTFEEGSDQWNEVADQIADKQSQVLDKTKDIMDLMNQVYSNNVSKQLDNWLKDTPLGADLDWMSDQWELINRNEDQYLDKTNSAYNIQKLQAKYLDLLDQSDNLLTQQKITDQMNQQLNMLRSKNKLSQYDVDYANAQLEILQKTIALQDAQNNKSQMKLRRDTQGNYSYVYTANEGDVKNAQSDLLDAQNNAYNLSKDQIKQTQDDSLSALQDAKSMIADIWANANLTIEERTNRTKTIIASLKEYLAGTADQLHEAEQNIIQDFIGMCEMMTDENKSGLDDVYDQIINGNDKAFSQIDTRWGDAISQWLGNLDQFNQATDKTFDGLIDNAKDYADKTQSLGEQVGLNFSDMTDAINAAKTATDDLAASTSGFIDKLEASSGTLKSYEKQLDEYKSRVLDLNNAMGEYQSKVNNLESSLQAEQRKNADLSDQLAASEAKYNAAYGNNGGSGSGGGAGGVGGSSDDVAYGIAQSIWTFGQKSGWGNNPIRSDKLNSGYGSDFAKKVQDIINQKVWSGSATDLVNYDSMSYSSYNLLGYDTGGYTGTWSETEGLDSDAKNGKLAILHQKELVLNETDTANILKAVEYVREMAQEMSSNGIMADLADRYNAWSTKVSEIQQSLAVQNGNIDQTVNVNAEFPNATSAEEIKTALNDLANAAIQYTGKRIGRYGLN